ncbi:MAG: response regulator [Acetobacteraceae bacterium]
MMTTPDGTTRLIALVVDDEAMLAEETAIGLEMAGIEAITAASAAEAMALLGLHVEIGVLITDIRMPRESGIALARAAMAQRTAANAIRVILMTGRESDVEPVDIHGWVLKPFRIERLVAMVHDAMRAVAGIRASAGGGGSVTAEPPAP